MIIKQNDIPKLIQTTISQLLKARHIVTLTGPLGAGKTTLTREILRHFGVNSSITSPTFGYVKSYNGTNNQQFHHFDLYRITTLTAFIDAGFDEYLTQENCICLIEWPEIIAPLFSMPKIKNSIVNISIDYLKNNDHKRKITITTP